MANRHFGNLGDVWKHLPLAAILDRERPARYWESHAGSALYPLTASPSRDFGVNTFLAQAPAFPLLRESIYVRLLSTLRGRYPGSPQIALRILGEITFYRFCDLDDTSLRDIQASAAQLGFPPGGVQVARADGLATLSAAGRSLSVAEARTTLALIDPFRPLEHGATGLHALGLFEQLAKQGVRTVLWYGYQTAREEEAWWTAAQPSLKVVDQVWFGQIDVVDERAVSTTGLLGCGILCANLSPQTATYCAALGDALAAAYADIRLPDGISGALKFGSSV